MNTPGEVAGPEALGHVRAFLRPRNAAATLRFNEAGEALVALHKLNIPVALHVSLLPADRGFHRIKGDAEPAKLIDAVATPRRLARLSCI